MVTISDGLPWEFVHLPAERQGDQGGFLRPEGAVEGAAADCFVEMRLADVVVAD
jgi:hypothetical protein